MISNMAQELYHGNESLIPATEINYVPAKLTRRVFANLLDILIFALLLVSLFSLARLIVSNTEIYKNNFNEMVNIKVDSGLYVKEDDDKTVTDIISYLNNDSNQTAGSKTKRARKAIETFFTYTKSFVDSGKISQNQYDIIAEDYSTFMLSEKMVYEGQKMFILDEEKGIIENPDLTGEASNLSNIHSYYFDNAYKPYIDKHLQGYLITTIPHYYELNEYVALTLIFAEILPSYLVSGLLVYLLPIFIFKHGRMTWGKAVYRIALLDKRVLSPKIGRSLARFAIFYFGELILSLVTFGIPYIISFTMMLVTKNKQGFPDYMLGLREVDCTSDKVYLSFDEITMDAIKKNKKAPEFTTRNFD